jgi:hypothetical protein
MSMSDKLKLTQNTPVHTNNSTKSLSGDPLPGDCCVIPPGGGDPGPGGGTPTP